MSSSSKIVFISNKFACKHVEIGNTTAMKVMHDFLVFTGIPR